MFCRKMCGDWLLLVPRDEYLLVLYWMLYLGPIICGFKVKCVP